MSTQPRGDAALSLAANGTPPVALPAVPLALLAVALFLARQQQTAGELWGVPVDDSYIHFRFAQNLLAGGGFAFNPGQPLPGSTSPLWVLLLAAAGRAGMPLWLAAKILGIACLCTAAGLTARLTRALTGHWWAGALAGALTALDGRLLWAAPSGMEVTLFAALCLLALSLAGAASGGDSSRARPLPSGRAAGYSLSAARSAHREGLISGWRGAGVGVVCGLAALARPEGVLFAAVLLAALWRLGRVPLRAVAGAALPCALIVAPYAAFALATTGHPLPTTFYAKSAGLPPDLAALAGRAGPYLAALAAMLAATNPALLLGAPVGAAVLWGRGWPGRVAVAWPLLLVLEQAVLSPYLYHFGRYVMPLDPFFILWAVAGAAWLSALARFPRQRREVAAIGALLLLAGTLAPLGAWADRYAGAVRNIDTMQVAIGGWARDHTPPGTPLAANDVGAIGYISGRPIVDIVGLVTPRFITLSHSGPPEARAVAMYRAVLASGARYLIIFPAVYSQLAAEPGLRTVFSVTVQPNVIEAANTMTVYALPLSRRGGPQAHASLRVP